MITELKQFIKKNLLKYSETDIFFRQQYKYVIDENEIIPNDMIIYRLEDYNLDLHPWRFKTAPFGAIKNQKGLLFAERVNFGFTGSSKPVDKFLLLDK